MNEENSGKVLILSLLLVVTFAAFAYGWFYYQDYRVIEQQRSKALRSAEIELVAESLNRETARLALRQVEAALATVPSLDDGVPPADELIRQRTRLQLALGHAAAAWEGIEAYVISPSSEADDLLLGARASMARFGHRGTQEEGLQAFGLLRRHFEQSTELGSLFLATVMAYRLTEVADFCELRTRLLAEHGDTREGRLLAGLGYSLAVHLSERIGFRADETMLEELAKSADGDDRSLLANLRVGAAADSIAGDRQALEILEEEFGVAPVELQIAIAEALVGRSGATTEDLWAGLRRVQKGLEEFPSCLEARNVAAVIHYALGLDSSRRGDPDDAERERVLCEDQLRWLTKNSRAADLRRSNWQAMRR